MYCRRQTKNSLIERLNWTDNNIIHNQLPVSPTTKLSTLTQCNLRVLKFCMYVTWNLSWGFRKWFRGVRSSLGGYGAKAQKITKNGSGSISMKIGMHNKLDNRYENLGGKSGPKICLKIFDI